MKAYTDIEQSRKLAEILPIESADMFYTAGNETQPTFKLHSYGHIISNEDIPCWSLAALFGLMPNVGACSPILIKSLLENKYYCHYMGIGTYKEVYTTPCYDNPIDACCEMILKLHEQNLL